jgi:hypothetical protein
MINISSFVRETKMSGDELQFFNLSRSPKISEIGSWRFQVLCFR